MIRFTKIELRAASLRAIVYQNALVIFFTLCIYSQKLFIALNGIFGVLFVTLFVPCSRQTFDLILNERNGSDVGSEGVFQSSGIPCGAL